ncbi:MAG: hypothetical protein IJW71_03870 [Clostridia bacterium]|nr:hypothetical protein [Clostridia bacterium]
MNTRAPELGQLTVSVFSAGGAFPLEGATVVITGNDADNRDIRHLRISDLSGRTEPVFLPAPSAVLSQTPGNRRPYATYNLEVSKDGYFPYSVSNLPVFSGIISIQPVPLIPLPSYDAENAFPRDVNSITQSEPNL